MERVLIVNADDFGLSKGKTTALSKPARTVWSPPRRRWSTARRLATLPSLAAASELAVGMHFVLTLGEPLSAMPGLTREGRLGKWIWQMAEEDSLPLDEIAHELECQYRRFVELFGHEPTHIDSHHHVHMIAQIYPIVAAFAREKGGAADRPAAGDAVRIGAGCGAQQRRVYQRVLRGRVSEALFLQTLDASIQRDERSLEVMCHPAFVDNTIMGSAYCYPRLTELDVLTPSR
jgi:predicted glycoside hydrolase/deacetylase ChbG (UPF0249 family)